MKTENGKRQINFFRINHIIYISLISLLIFLFVFCILSTGKRTKKEKSVTITIAIVQDEKVQNPETNYYKQWLEEKLGYKIQFEYIQPGYEKEYIYAMLTSEHSNIDVVFFPKGEAVITGDEFREYVGAGLLIDLASYINSKSNLKRILAEYQEYYLEDNIKDKDGGIYYIPNMDTSRKKRNFQIMWINMDWLKQLKLQVPHTTDQLYEVLCAFRDHDPNRNGLKDELPLIGCEEEYELQSYNYLINAFCYNDPLHMRFYEDGQNKICFAPVQESFREGLRYCASLHEEGLLSEISFSFSKKQVMEIVNAPENMVGAFTSQSISDIIYTNSNDVVSKFIQIPPLEGPTGERNAVRTDYVPTIGGCIPANSKHPEEAYELMDLMLSEEASLISEYGEEGVDWEISAGGDLSTYGSKARITTLNYLKDIVQNKHLAGTGPQVVDESYVNGVTWNGDNSLLEYIDTRAIKGYEPFYHIQSDKIHEIYKEGEDDDLLELKLYTDEMIKLFITGRLDINSDESWNSNVKGFNKKIGKYSEVLNK